MDFEKYTGIGNDFILTDYSNLSAVAPDKIQRICDRNFGVGGDGIIALERKEEKRWVLRFYNSDGTSAKMCVNGIRCAALFVRRRHDVRRIDFETVSGTKPVDVIEFTPKKGVFRVEMGTPKPISSDQFSVSDASNKFFYNFKTQLGIKEYESTFVSMGNPHCVIKLSSDPYSVGEDEIQSYLRRNKAYFPEGVNLELVKVEGSDHVIQRTWERGVGETYACGSGACAVFWSLYNSGLVGKSCDIDLKGGRLRLTLGEKDNIILEGPSEYIFSGHL